MQTPDKKKLMFLDMQEHPEKYSEEQIEAMMDELDQMPDIGTAWQKFEQNNHQNASLPSRNWWKAAATFIGILMISGIAFAAVHILSPSNTKNADNSEQKMLTAVHDGDAIVAIVVNFCKGTWIQNGDDSYIEEHPAYSFGFRLKSTTVKLDGMELDAHMLPNLPASALKKMEIGRKDGRGFANLITTPVKIPANLKGNINPELTILLTSVVPQNATARSSIYVKRGLHEGFDWKEYQYTSWSGQAENVRKYLEEVAISKKHHVRINICKGVSNKHIDRIKKIMEECNVTNYELIQQ